MIWIYGGSFNSGTSSLEVYDGRIMADIGDVVIVSFNYRLKYNLYLYIISIIEEDTIHFYAFIKFFIFRLGPFGFLVQLDESVGDNAGLLDQRLALKWVADNIEKFGGDPQ